MLAEGSKFYDFTLSYSILVFQIDYNDHTQLNVGHRTVIFETFKKA